jgi:hypothetical protein
MKMTSKNLLVASAALIASAVLVLPSRAQVVAYSTPGTETDLAGYGLSGFEFTPTANLDVTALGFTGVDVGGGDTPHVSLWNASAGVGALTLMYDTGNILTSVKSYTDNTPANPAMPSFVSVGTPILLTAGTTYLVTAPAYWASTFNTTSTPSGITVNSPLLGTTEFLKASGGWNGFANSGYDLSSLAAASATATPTAANLQFTAIAAPEPSTYAMLGAGLLTLVVTLRRRAKLER